MTEIPLGRTDKGPIRRVVGARLVGLIFPDNPDNPDKEYPMAKLNEGDVRITLNGETRTLKPTLRAMQTISGQFGGLGKVREGLVQQDFNTVVFVIRHGLNLTDREAKTLPDDVYGNGLDADLLIPLIRYVGILANGGKPMPDDPVDMGDQDAVGNA